MATMLSNLAGSYVTTAQLVVSLACILLVYGIYKISTFIRDEVTSPSRDIPGPTSPSFLYGNLKELSASYDSVLQEDWLNQYGPTIQFKGVLGTSRLLTTDLKAINYILFNSYDYPKSEEISYTMRQLFGNGVFSGMNRDIFFRLYKGVLVVEGDVHKHQRKILNPAFGPQQIRDLTVIFLEKALELRDIWSTEIVKHDGVAPIECLSWMSRTTLDIIGLAGFNYKFNALTSDPEKNDLIKSFSTIFKAGAKPSIIPMLKAMYPPLRFLPAPNDAATKKASAVMGRIGSDLLRQSKASLKDDKRSKSSGRKDILSLLVQANTMQDLPEAHRMKDEDVVAQIPTFITAGHETISIAMTWALYSLTQNKQAQTKLRQEVSDVSTDNPTMDDLNGLPYLDAVVRETLRLHPSIPSLIRAAKKNDCIPLSQPFTDRKGVVRNEIRVRKGQSITVPIFFINRDKSIWGEDSTEFKPERWVNIPDAAASVPGVWANMMTFIGGPRACIGYRFSILSEIKSLLFTLIRAFEFELAVSAQDVATKPTSGVLRPVLLTDPTNSNQMPLLVRAMSNL
ncbi:cytochrome P450 [Phlegmacium glaucopus]|nr:cytochrome P450 [Phlegmacium glaucopus]